MHNIILPESLLTLRWRSPLNSSSWELNKKKKRENFTIVINNIEHVWSSDFTAQRVMTEKFTYCLNSLKLQILLNYKLGRKEKSNNNARNKTTVFHQYMPELLIIHCTMSNKTIIRCCFDQPFSKRVRGNSEMSRHFLYILRNVKALATKTLRIRTTNLGCIVSFH